MRRSIAFDPTVAFFIMISLWTSSGTKIQEDRDHAVVTVIVGVNVLQVRDVFLPLLELLLQLVHVLGDRRATYPVARAVNIFCSLLLSRVVSLPVTFETEAWACGLYIAQQLAFCVLDPTGRTSSPEAPWQPWG